MKRLRFLLIPFIAAMLSLPVLATAAQTPATGTPAAGATPNIDDMDGIEAAISRTYGLDVEAMIAATPDLQPEDFGKGVTALSAMVLRFDSEEHAKTAHDTFHESLEPQLLELGQVGTPTVTEEPVTDLGTEASATTLNTKTEDQETYFRFVLVLDGEYVFLLSALASMSEDVLIADELAEYVVNEGEDQGDEAIFIAEGGSSGGLWGFLPEDDHEVLDGLIAIVDETLYPAPQQPSS